MYVCRDFGDISKWLPIQSIIPVNSNTNKDTVMTEKADKDISLIGGLGSMISYAQLKNAFLEIRTAIKGKCSIYKSKDFIGKAPLSANDLSLLNELKDSKDVTLLLALKLMQTVYKNEAGSQGNLPTTSNYVEKGNGIIITNKPKISDCAGIESNGLYFYAVYTAPFGKAYGVNTHKIKQEVNADIGYETLSEAVSDAKAGKTVFVRIKNYSQVEYLRHNYPDILSSNKSKLTNNKEAIYGFSSLDWIPEYYLGKLEDVKAEQFDKYIGVNSLSSNLTYFCVLFLLDCMYNLPGSKNSLLSIDFTKDELSNIKTFVVPMRKDNESDKAYNLRCKQAVNAWAEQLNSKPGLKKFIGDQNSLNRFTFISNVSVRYNNIIKGLGNG